MESLLELFFRLRLCQWTGLVSSFEANAKVAVLDQTLWSA